MSSSPSKRRKISPTASVPGNAPSTPSRIPVRREGTTSRRPSFASPTKASISRHNPQLLNRPSLSGAESSQAGRSGGTNLDDVFARALGEAGPGTAGEGLREREAVGLATKENVSAEIQTPAPDQGGSKSTRSTRSVGGALSAKPRRKSQSPTKQTTQQSAQSRPGEGEEEINPFRRTGLRRSPIVSQSTETLPEVADPFKKRGLRRSPVSSNPPGKAIPAVPTPEPPKAVDHLPRVEHATTEGALPIQQDIGPNISRASLESLPSQKLTEASVANLPSEKDKTPEIERFAAESPTPLPATTIIADEAEPIHQATQPPVDPGNALVPRTANSEKSSLPFPSPQVETEVLRNKADKVVPSPAVQQTISESRVQQELPRQSPRRAQPRRSEARAPELIRSNRREETTLPPTPTQMGIPDPVVTTPPSGIHDTPSRRAKKNKALAQRLKSSPLKPKEPRPLEPEKETEPAVREPALQSKPKQQETVTRRKSARFIIPEDPHAAKKKERDQVLRELQQLQADIALTKKENERLRSHFDSKKAPPAAPPNAKELSEVLLRSTAPTSLSKPEPKPKSIFRSIGSFLPFSSRRTRKPTPAVIEKPIPTHLPVALDDPLPYFQVFSPLTYTSNISLLPPSVAASEAEGPTLQQHFISASHPAGLFNARLTMTVDSSLLSVVSLDVSKLDPSSEEELGPFVRANGDSNGPVKKDIGVICWAMGRWVEVSIARARFWCAVERDFATPEARAKSLQRKKKRKHHRVVTDDDDTVPPGDEAGDDEEEGAAKRKYTRRDLLPHMGRKAMEVATDTVELRFEWRLGFDWTGEVESFISASARLPKKWEEIDDRGSLRKVPESFDRLVKQKGPLGAVRTIVGLLMPS